MTFVSFRDRASSLSVDSTVTLASKLNDHSAFSFLSQLLHFWQLVLCFSSFCVTPQCLIEVLAMLASHQLSLPEKWSRLNKGWGHRDPKVGCNVWREVNNYRLMYVVEVGWIISAEVSSVCLEQQIPLCGSRSRSLPMWEKIQIFDDSLAASWVLLSTTSRLPIDKGYYDFHTGMFGIVGMCSGGILEKKRYGIKR